MSIIKNNKNYGIETKITQAPPQTDKLIFTNTSGQINQLKIHLNPDNYYTRQIKNGKYSLDEGATWTSLPADADGLSISSNVNVYFTDKIILTWDYIDIQLSTSFDYSNIYFLQITKNSTVSGDLYSTDNFYYSGFFSGSKLTDASGLILHGNSLNNYCYAFMFFGCTALTTAPALPATRLGDYCYDGMFRSCTALTTAPALPATRLKNSCYYQMFSGCTALTTPPVLPATTLQRYCYQNMFSGCTALTTAPALPATTLAEYSYGYMFQNCTSLTTAPVLPATTLQSYCYQYMFQGCSALTTAPVLPATTLVTGCYSYMFQGCSNLNYIKAMFTTTPTQYAYTYNWVQGVAANGTFVKNASATWDVRGVYAIPNDWTVETASE